MIYKVIASSSKGNAVLVDRVLVDVGVPFNKIEPYINDFDLILITHVHLDHLNVKTVEKICSLKPLIKVVTHSEVALKLTQLGSKVVIIDLGQTYTRDLKNGYKYEIKPVLAYHNVKTFGYRIFIYDTFFDEIEYKVFYMTDSGTLEGIAAKDYDYYFLETNYCEEKIERISEILQEKGEFDNTERVKLDHLSRQETENFYINNKKENSELVTLHHSSRNY